MAEQWLSIVEYARTYKISDMTVRRRIKTGRLEAVLQDGKYYIPIRPTTTPKNTAANCISALDEEAKNSGSDQSSTTNSRVHSGQIQIIKGHPSAPRQYPEIASPVPKETKDYAPPFIQSYQATSNERVQTVLNSSPSRATETDNRLIPSSLRSSLIRYETSLIDSNALLSFCETALRKVQDGERKTVERFKSKLEALEAHILAKDNEIKNLKQQLEDLQLLVKILEGRKNSVGA